MARQSVARITSQLRVELEELNDGRRGPRREKVSAGMDVGGHGRVSCGRIELAYGTARLARGGGAVNLAIKLDVLLEHCEGDKGIVLAADDHHGAWHRQVLARRQVSA